MTSPTNYPHHHKAPAAPLPEIVYSCEICGQDDLNESQMRLHMESVHLKGAVQCPFCDLSSSDVSANEMTLHVNTAHLEYLTPEREDVAFLEDYDNSDFDSIWQLEKDAKEGLTNGVDESPTQAKYLNFEPKVQESSPMSTSTEVSSESPLHTSASAAAASGGAIQKRFKLCNSANASPSKSGLSLSIKPNWAPLAEAGIFRHDKVHKCPLCEHECKDPSKLEEHVNRVHFDPQSPAAETMKNLDNNKTPTSNLPCPLCTAYYSTSLELERHVNHDHSDVLSPMTTKRRPSLPSTASPTNDLAATPSSSSSTSLRQMQPGSVSRLNYPRFPCKKGLFQSTDGNGNQECPVCNVGGFHNQNQLAEHIESHFNEPPKASKRQSSAKRNGGGDGHSISSMSSSSSTSSSSTSKPSNDYLLAQELERRERERRKHEEQREFNQLRAQFGMDNDGNFHTQSISNMQNAVYRGEMSVVDYYERQSELRNAEKSGMDDGRSVSKHLMPKLRNFCQTAHGVAQTYLCSVVDHHSSSFGDKGWGCGYRNLQMLLSSLAHHTPYAERLGITKGMGVASISRLQGQIEAAWRKGFDVQGSDQLGGKFKQQSADFFNS